MARRTQLSFASFNLYNLNLPGLRIYRDSDGWSQADYDNKIAWASEKVRDLNADVWGFQELWHTDALKKCFRKPGYHPSTSSSHHPVIRGHV